MNAASLNTAVYRRNYITISDQTDSCACFSGFSDNAFMTFPVKNNNCQVRNLSVHCISNVLQIFCYGSIDVDTAFCSWSDADFLHIHIRSMKLTSFRSNSQYCNGSILSFGNQIRSFYRIDSNINFFSACTYMFPDIKHRGFINFAFPDNNSTGNRCLCELFMHSVDSSLVSPFLVAGSHQPSALQCSLFGNPYEFH